MIGVPKAVLVAALLWGAAGTAASFQNAGPGAVRSLLEARHQNVVIQEWDSSCGAAALATVLQFQLGDPVSERTVAVGMLRGVDPDVVRTRGGFSLLDLKRYAQARGYAADGYAGLAPGQLLRLAPAIVPIRSHGGDHFVVFRGVVNGQAVLADPAFGNRSMPFPTFEASWKDRLAFVVKSKAANANRMKGSPRDVLRVEDEAARKAMDDSLPRPLADAQLALLFAAEPLAPSPASSLVPIAAPERSPARAASPGSASSTGSTASPGSSTASPSVVAPVTSGVTSPATSPAISSPIATISPGTTLSPGTTTISAPLLPPISVTAPVTAPSVTITAPSLPPLTSPLGR